MNEEINPIEGLSDEERAIFDEHLDMVLQDIPPQLQKLLDEVPLLVEDFPSDEIIEQMDLEYRDDICGLHDGIPLTERSVEHSGQMPETITIYREGILSASADEEGYIDGEELLQQIYITILHEIGHHFGLDEVALEKLGFD